MTPACQKEVQKRIDVSHRSESARRSGSVVKFGGPPGTFRACMRDRLHANVLTLSSILQEVGACRRGPVSNGLLSKTAKEKSEGKFHEGIQE